MIIEENSGELIEKLKLMGASDWNVTLKVLTSTTENWHQSEVRGLFSAMVGLRIGGYLPVYPIGTLPLDLSDYVCTHFFLGIENRNHFIPLLTYKMVLFSECQKYRIPFPSLAISEAARASSVSEFLKNSLDQCEFSPEHIAYGGGWTARPELRMFREFGSYLKEVMASALTHFSRESELTRSVLFWRPTIQNRRIFRAARFSARVC
jgi:hypothetical protein